MIDLAQKYQMDETPVMMSDIARRQALSRKYLHALLTPLKTAGLVCSTRGAKGGYFLAKPPSEITLSDILTALEGKLSIVDCVTTPDDCGRQLDCPARAVWCELTKIIDDKLRSVTLQQILKDPTNPMQGEGQ
jgi:Rrf2 family protein